MNWPREVQIIRKSNFTENIPRKQLGSVENILKANSQEEKITKTNRRLQRFGATYIFRQQEPPVSKNYKSWRTRKLNLANLITNMLATQKIITTQKKIPQPNIRNHVRD